MTTETPTTPRTALKEKMHVKKASLTEIEMAFLHGLLIDEPPRPLGIADEASAAEKSQQLEHATQVLDDDMLFTVPQDLVETRGGQPVKRPSKTKKKKDYRFLVGLWQAHEDGVTPQKLKSVHQRQFLADALAEATSQKEQETKEEKATTESEEVDEKDDGDNNSVNSDEEVRPESTDGDDSSDWDEKEGGFDHFDAWQILKDEYASDFGFDFTSPATYDGTDSERNTFKILGTSADDTSAHPHVLSPPVMDALMKNLPEHLKGQNFWMKFSLVRDGANLDTFKRYVRAAKDSILAIETVKGEVFGCYTSSPWRTNNTFYGGAPSFVWRMKNNRTVTCHSLIEQARMESEIEVFNLVPGGQKPQCSTSDMIGIGEGNLTKYDIYGDVLESREEAELRNGKNYGFAIALEDDLLSGTTSKCASYQNPCLVKPSSNGEAFEVLNLELWTFTPCFSVESAEQLEMTQFFVSESLRNVSMRSNGGSNSRRSNSLFSSSELKREDFYRRLGYGDEHEALREQWQYRTMMDGESSTKSIGHSPRFSVGPGTKR